MPGTTKNDISDILALLPEYYRLPVGPIQISPINTGVENANYLVVAGDQKYILRIYNQKHSIRGERSPESITLELQFMDAARRAAVPVPGVVPLNNRDIFGAIKELKRYFVLLEFAPGKSPDTFSETIVEQLSGVVSRLFSASKLLGSAGQMTHDILSRGFTKYELYEQKKHTQNPADTLLARLHDKLLSDQDRVTDRLSKGLVHGDLKLENTLFTDDGTLSAVLDFDDYRYAYLIEDAAMALMHNLHAPAENMLRSGYYEAFVAAIDNQVLQAEINHGLRYMLGVRFLYDCSKYLLDGNHSLVDELLQDPNVTKYVLSDL